MFKWAVLFQTRRFTVNCHTIWSRAVNFRVMSPDVASNSAVLFGLFGIGRHTRLFNANQKNKKHPAGIISVGARTCVCCICAPGLLACCQVHWSVHEANRLERRRGVRVQMNPDWAVSTETLPISSLLRAKKNKQTKKNFGYNRLSGSNTAVWTHWSMFMSW